MRRFWRRKKATIVPEAPEPVDTRCMDLIAAHRHRTGEYPGTMEDLTPAELGVFRTLTRVEQSVLFWRHAVDAKRRAGLRPK